MARESGGAVLLPSSVVSLGSPQVAPAPPRPLNVLGVGLSIMAPNDPTSPGNGQTLINSAGYLGWANYLLSGKLNMGPPSGKICGIAGAPSGPISDHTSLLYRLTNPSDQFYALGLNPPPDIVFCQLDSGDDPAPGTMSYAQSWTNLQAIFQALMVAYPKALFWATTLPGVAITGNAARRAAINPLIRSFCQANNLRLLDYEAITTDLNTGRVIAGEAVESAPNEVHPNAIGALRVSRYIAREFLPYVPQGSMLIPDVYNDSRVQSSQGGWGSDAMMLNTGTGGRNDTTGLNDAGLATNWHAAGPVPTGSVFSLIQRGDGKGNWQRMTFPSGGGQLLLYHFAGVGSLPAGAVVYAECEVRTHGNLTGLTDCGLLLQTFTSGVNATCLVSAGTNHGPPADPGPGVRGVLQTYPITIPGGGASTPFAQFQITATGGSIDVGRFSFVRVS